MFHRLEVTEQALLDAIETVANSYEGDDRHPLWVRRRCREAVSDLLDGSYPPGEEYQQLRVAVIGEAKRISEKEGYQFSLTPEQ